MSDMVDVSIPYGKGKAELYTKIPDHLFVSIPYGKGKVAGGIAFAEWLLYQFPMGKVKVLIFPKLFPVVGINSLWER